MTLLGHRSLVLAGAVAIVVALGCVGSPAATPSASAPTTLPSGVAARTPTTGRTSAPFAAGSRACLGIYPAARCDAMLTQAAEILSVPDDDVSSIEIAPEPTPRTDGILETLGGARGVTVLADVDGTIREVVMCGGIPSGPACMDQPAVSFGSPIGAGYEDVPCTGEPPDGCPTPLPSRDPAAVRAAHQLRIDQRVIPVVALGQTEVSLGTATIPNGVLTVAHGELDDPWPDGVRFSSRGLWLDLRSLVPGRPAFRNLYEHGWWPGTEAVEVFLVFDVRHVEPGATIEVRKIVVG